MDIKLKSSSMKHSCIACYNCYKTHEYYDAEDNEYYSYFSCYLEKFKDHSYGYLLHVSCDKWDPDWISSKSLERRLR